MSAVERAFEEEFSQTRRVHFWMAFLLFQLRRARDAIKVRGGQVRNFAHMKNARCQSYTLENWLES